jgi:hypothetical protein
MSDALLWAEDDVEWAAPAQKFYSEDQLRDERGRWTEGGGAAEHGRAWEGKQVELKNKLSKDATGKIGQQVVLDYLHENGLIDAKPMNDEHNNYAIDMVQDHGAIEIKCGQVSNGQSAQQWRATIGEPPPRVKEWLKTATPTEKKAFNAAESKAILDRKEAARARLEKELGRPVKAWTYAVIINPDKGTADIYKFKGYHLRIGWNSDQAKAGYVTTVKYGKH